MRGSEHKPTPDTRAKVAKWIAQGVDQTRIARALGLADPKAIRKHYRKEIDTSAGEYDVDFEASFLRRGMIERPEYNAVAIFIAKVRLGYRETVAIDPLREKPSEELGADDLRARVAAAARAAREETVRAGRPARTARA